MRDNDLIGIRLPDGRYVIRRWWARTRRWGFVDGHLDTYDRAETLRRLQQLREPGDASPREPDPPRLIES
jgi:hypothetical protein